MNHRPKVRVVKLGGSLLEQPGLADLLRKWVGSQTAAANILIVGGGALADAVRRLDALHHLGQQAAHHLCLAVMSVTAQMVQWLLPEAKLVLTVNDLAAELRENSASILDVRQFLQHDQLHSADPLPEHWDVTSDSIAARVADILAAEELVLLKSALPTHADALQQLSDRGYVDRYFSRAASGLFVRCVNLLDANFAQSCIGPTATRSLSERAG